MSERRQSGETAPTPCLDRPVRVVVADPHPIARWGLRRILEAAGAVVVGECGTRHEAVAAAEELHPDVIVVDSWLTQGEERFAFPAPGTTGRCRVVVLGPPGEPAFARQARRRGADAFLPKSEAPTALAGAVTGPAHTPEADRAPGASRRPAGHVPDGPETGPLAPEETAILRLLAWGYSPDEIAARLGVSRGDADASRARLAEKLGVRTRAELVRVALRRDLMGPLPD